jgi:hypothetical protein
MERVWSIICAVSARVLRKGVTKMNYIIWGLPEEKPKKKLKLRPQAVEWLLNKLCALACFITFCIYITGLVVGADFETWLDVSMIGVLLGWAYFRSLEYERDA